MKNNVDALNNYLFGQLERLGNPDLEGDELKAELERTDAVTKTATAITNNMALALKAATIRSEFQGRSNIDIPDLLMSSSGSKK